MSPARGLSRSILVSLLLHAALALLLWFAARETILTEPAPVSVELWSAAPPTPAVVAKPVEQPQPPTMPTPEAPKADVQLGKKPEVKKQLASQPKPEAKPKAETKPANKGKQPAKHYNDDSNDLLAELGSSNTSRAPNARIDQAGAQGGVAGGSPRGTSQARDNYAAKVRAKILPLVQLPPGLQGNPMAVVQVVLLPTLEVRSVTLLQTSGNTAYDEAVQRAIREAGTFPSLPAGTRFGDVRQLRLEFRPH
ncbi:cell envelope integrity protein TolA [Paludibacterium purpuratum]|uniref:Cell division and transport-associated protein TolA n=1 Tax=Paludibacterium purpuratum TaxID=1144873 RepID=A0A4V3DVB8_9NEIS|nr:cell envelope integrity protein TolA [Paludibacterium purpuratum]TDR80379.1 cell division and transport-associated protein TolA [Paludibacterium purpuratum]